MAVQQLFVICGLFLIEKLGRCRVNLTRGLCIWDALDWREESHFHD